MAKKVRLTKAEKERVGTTKRVGYLDSDSFEGSVIKSIAMLNDLVEQHGDGIFIEIESYSDYTEMFVMKKYPESDKKYEARMIKKLKDKQKKADDLEKYEIKMFKDLMKRYGDK